MSPHENNIVEKYSVIIISCLLLFTLSEVHLMPRYFQIVLDTLQREGGGMAETEKEEGHEGDNSTSVTTSRSQRHQQTSQRVSNNGFIWLSDNFIRMLLK